MLKNIQSLGQIAAGSWRQIAWAQKQGIPKLLGLSTEDWAKQRLGGYSYGGRLEPFQVRSTP
jgi:hypothetical protein